MQAKKLFSKQELENNGTLYLCAMFTFLTRFHTMFVKSTAKLLLKRK